MNPRYRLALVFATVLLLVVPLLLPAHASPALIPGAHALAHSGLGLALALLAAAVAVLHKPAGPTGIAAALCLLALVHTSRMSVRSSSSSYSCPALGGAEEQLSVRAGLASAVALATAGALQRWPGVNTGYALIGAAATVHLAGMAHIAKQQQPRGRGGEEEASRPPLDAESSSSAAADTPNAAPAMTAMMTGGEGDDAAAIRMVPVRVSVQTLPEEPSPRQAPFASTLEEHLVQKHAPPNQATKIFNAPAYGPALVGGAAAAASFKHDVSEVSRKMAEASGIYV